MDQTVTDVVSEPNSCWNDDIASKFRTVECIESIFILLNSNSKCSQLMNQTVTDVVSEQ